MRHCVKLAFASLRSNEAASLSLALRQCPAAILRQSLCANGVLLLAASLLVTARTIRNASSN